MRSIRLRILVICAVLVAVGVGAWQLLPATSAKKKDAIAVGTTDEVTSLDPAGAYDAGSWAMYSNVFQSLLTFKQGASLPVPDAAKSCRWLGTDLTSYGCELRDDLTFSNGRGITAEDVKYSFDRMMGIKADAGPSSLFPTLKSVSAQGRSVTFKLSARDATFPQKVATGAGSIVDREHYPRTSLREGTGVDGSGPYVLRKFEVGGDAELEPNPRYKGALVKQGGPVTVRYYKDSDDMADAWKAHRIDVAHRQMPPEFIADMDRTKDGVRVTEADSAEIRNLVFNVRKGAPLAKRAVRQAVASVVDRQKIAGSVYHSTVEPLYSLIPQGFLGHTTSFFDRYPQPDAKEAKELLRDAGVQTPVRFTLAHRDGETYAAEAAELKRELDATGLFEVTVKPVAWKTFLQEYARGTYDAFTVGWLPDFPDSDSFTQPLVSSGNSMHNGYASKAVDGLIQTTQQYGERSQAVQDFKAIQQEVAKDVPLLPLWQKKDYVLSSGDVAGSQYLTDGTGIWRLWELSWL
ncbi:ABC transporter substrate-binding protein [Streptomyces sp. NPDC001941]|uniref:ABC transporter substrate-binding protein n=1 Tax=Streptomyces sp. NPDC001941 TaxID=3154659 RepID=UPI0033339F72